MSITKKFLSALTATICAATACVCSVSVSAEKISATTESEGLVYVAVDEDENGTYDFARIVGCSEGATKAYIPIVLDNLKVKEVTEYAFTSSSLVSIDVEEGHQYFAVKDSVLFDANFTTLISYPAARIVADTYTIPSTVTEIADCAFYNCKELTNITIPNSTVEIGDYAFFACQGLSDITIPSSVESVGEYAFLGTELLNSQNGPLYYADTWLLYCDNSVTTVKEDSVPIEPTTRGIAGGAFSDCSSLKMIDIPSKVLYIGDYAFEECASLSSVSIPSSVKTIGFGAFSNCTGLVTLSIPNTVSKIEGYAFDNCENLSEINIPTGVSVLEEGVFRGCSSLLSIDIPNNIKEIEKLAFIYCSNLNKVVINNKACVINNTIETFSNDGVNKFTGKIHGYAGSTAQEYATNFNIGFVTLGATAVLGDANNDGKLTVSDAAFIARTLAKRETIDVETNPDADYNNDGKVTVSDAAAIARDLAKKVV